MQNDFIQDWVRGRAALNVKQSSNKLQRHPYEPCYLYESGIRPLEQFPVKGFIWYQGESNAHNREAHESCSDCWWKVGARIGGMRNFHSILSNCPV